MKSVHDGLSLWFFEYARRVLNEAWANGAGKDRIIAPAYDA